MIKFHHYWVCTNMYQKWTVVLSLLLGSMYIWTLRHFCVRFVHIHKSFTHSDHNQLWTIKLILGVTENCSEKNCDKKEKENCYTDALDSRWYFVS